MILNELTEAAWAASERLVGSNFAIPCLFPAILLN
jgi:hypothetical protein